MKKWHILVIWALSVVFGLSVVRAQDSTAAWITVTTYLLNVRSGPATSYPILTKIGSGESYPIIGRNADSSWWQIRLNSLNGWVSARYVAAANTAGVPVTVPQGCAFSTYIAPHCPDTQISTEVATQSFQDGTMLWRKDTREIYVLYNSGFLGRALDTWAGEALPQETPPSGLQQPQLGFGKAWLDNPAIRQALGWASSSEIHYQSFIETVTNAYPGPSDDFLYVTLSTGQVIWINPYLSQWG